MKKTIKNILFLFIGFSFTSLLSCVGKSYHSNHAIKDTEVINPYKIIENYIDSSGGRSKLMSVKSLLFIGVMKINDHSISFISKEMYPNKQESILKKGDSVIIKEVYNGTEGYKLINGTKQKLNDELIKHNSDKKALFPQLLYNNGSYKLTLEGIASINGRDAYKILIESPTGVSGTEYYDKNNKQLVRADGTQSFESLEKDFSDFRKVSGIVLPFKSEAKDKNNLQSITNIIYSVKINEGVAAEDFE